MRDRLDPEACRALNPRPPLDGRCLQYNRAACPTMIVSIHARPLDGRCDFEPPDCTGDVAVSIHARPLTGDAQLTGRVPAVTGFNPRPPF
ncbi:MAG: hypothetical protein R3F53_03970 [Gammaproteobacteria bacterium]